MSKTVGSRYLSKLILSDLSDKMVFLGGPRQVGKTTLCQALLRNYRQDHPAYFNWDDNHHRRLILAKAWSAKEKIIILDEIHKYAKWRNLVKGFYDTQKLSHSFLVTGSARLDYYSKGDDSLFGRYHYYRLHPYSVSELGGSSESLQKLLKFGGFPEPLLKGSERTLRRWQNDRMSRVVQQDLRDLEYVKEISLMTALAEALPMRVGSPLSINNLAEDLSVDPKTVKRWIEILENLYFVYRISPFGAPKIKAVKKEKKLYMWDWSVINSIGFRFENLVASHLLKYCHFLEDSEGFKMELRFLRDVEKREIDFVVLQDGKPKFAVECKSGETNLSPHIPYFLARTKIPKFYQVHLGSQHRKPMDQVEILPFIEFCKTENLV